ncbi:integrase [Nitrosospira multiformis]|uniref:Integrase n=1 Tax=Nitrosospira multiformis TaxID=1231 RepID=A0A2T5I955_9PROT|nr:tyrosine-type recombinase/integrase [Nitrosospira multiformis]PTQ80372.1 integrase [Nitrosospira multiformis]
MLSDIQCRNAKPRAKSYKLTDGKGLYLEVKSNGVKAWRYRFRLHGKENVFAIGDYPTISLVNARKAREGARDLVKQGISPVQARRLDRIKREKEAATTFEAVAVEWLALKEWEEITKNKRLSMLRRVVFPAIGQIPIKQIDPSIILTILKKAAEKNGASVMAEAKRTMYGIFELAAETFRVDSNPVHQWREALPKNKTQHKRPLDAVEIGALLRDLEKHKGRYETVAAFRLMWLTLCRTVEACEAQWSEFDLDAALWRIPAGRMKKRKEHVVPLPAQAVTMLHALHGITGHHAHLFPNRDDRTRPMSTASFRQMLCTLGWAGRFSPHATRTTGSTRLNEMRFPSDWIEKQLAHTEPNQVRRTYNHADYFSDRVKMMQHWADYLDELKPGATVLPFKKIAS